MAATSTGAANADAHTRSAANERTIFFMLTGVNSAIAAFNPAADSAADMHDVVESGYAQELCGDGAVIRILAVHENGLILIRQQLGKLSLDRRERRVERPGD